MKRRSLRGDVLVKVMLALALLAPIWYVPYPPLQDYPNHLARAYIALHLHDPATPFARYYALVPYPVPNSLSDLILMAVGALVPLALAGKILLSLLLVGFPLAFERFLAAVRPRDAALYGYFGWALAYNHLFQRGYLNYILGVTCLFLSLWAYTRLWNTSAWRDALPAAFFTVLTFLAHALASALLMAIVLVALLNRRPRRKALLLSAGGWVASAAVFLLYARAAHPPLTMAPYPSLRDRGVALAQVFMAYDPPRDLVTIAPVLVLWLALLALRLKQQPWNTWLEAAGLLCLIALLMPRSINIMVRPGQRVLLVALLVAVAGFPSLPRRPAWYARALLSLVTLVVSLRVAAAYIALQPDLADIAACVRAATPAVPTAHLVFTPYRGSIHPEKHAVEYAVLWRDAPVSNLFATYSLLRTSLPATTTLADLDPAVYPQVITVGTPPARPRGYVAVWQGTGCTVWRRAG